MVDAMEKTTVYLGSADYRRLKTIAQRSGRKPAELVREAVAEYAARHSDDRLPASVAAIKSGRSDLAAKDERYLEGFGGRRDRR